MSAGLVGGDTAVWASDAVMAIYSDVATLAQTQSQQRALALSKAGARAGPSGLCVSGTQVLQLAHRLKGTGFRLAESDSSKESLSLPFFDATHPISGYSTLPAVLGPPFPAVLAPLRLRKLRTPVSVLIKV